MSVGGDYELRQFHRELATPEMIQEVLAFKAVS